uniref:Uncharacterized protein n=1 Tax=Caenorhabditis japonica TaxID=281687 RepID=A0A8R1EKF0_CAEJA
MQWKLYKKRILLNDDERSHRQTTIINLASERILDGRWWGGGNRIHLPVQDKWFIGLLCAWCTVCRADSVPGNY